MTIALNTLIQRLSYIVGENMAHQLKNDGLSLDTAALSLAIDDVMSDQPSRLTDDEKRRTVEQVQFESQQQQQAAQAAQSEKNTAEGARYLAENAQKAGVTTTASGLQYQVIAQGTGPTPTTHDRVQVHYKGTLIDGSVFDSSYDRGEPIVFPVTGVIPGWVEALQLMPVGSRYALTIPAHLAYGERGSSPAIGPNATLLFEVELLAIQ